MSAKDASSLEAIEINTATVDDLIGVLELYKELRPNDPTSLPLGLMIFGKR